MKKIELIEKMFGIFFVSLLAAAALIYGNVFTAFINFVNEDYYTLISYYDYQLCSPSMNIVNVSSTLLYMLSSIILILYVLLFKKKNAVKITIFSILAILCAEISFLVYNYSYTNPTLLISSSVISLASIVFYFLSIVMGFINLYPDYTYKNDVMGHFFFFACIIFIAIAQSLKPLLVNAVNMIYDQYDLSNPRIRYDSVHSILKVLDVIIITVPPIGSLFFIPVYFQTMKVFKSAKDLVDSNMVKYTYFIPIIYLVTLVGAIIITYFVASYTIKEFVSIYFK